MVHIYCSATRASPARLRQTLLLSSYPGTPAILGYRNATSTQNGSGLGPVGAMSSPKNSDQPQQLLQGNDSRQLPDPR